MLFNATKSINSERLLTKLNPKRLSPAALPALVAQLDARPTGDQEVAGSTPAGSATLFRGD